MRGVREGPTRTCKVCDAVYERKSYGWCYGACCSHACQCRAHGDFEAEPRSADRIDCANYKRCFDEAAREPRDHVCRLDCARYEHQLPEPKRAGSSLMSHACMWSEA